MDKDGFMADSHSLKTLDSRSNIETGNSYFKSYSDQSGLIKSGPGPKLWMFECSISPHFNQKFAKHLYFKLLVVRVTATQKQSNLISLVLKIYPDNKRIKRGMSGGSGVGYC